MVLADLSGEQAVQRRGHHGQLQIDVDLQRDGRREGVHVERVDRLGDGVLDQDAAGVAVHEGGRLGLHLVGDQQSRFGRVPGP